jgi:hypothetical protein
LIWLALLEGGKREESADTAGAWKCYRAILGVTTHFRRRGRLEERYAVNRQNGWLWQRLTTWVSTPRTTIPQLHIALQELLDSEPRPEWDAVSLKLKYLEMMRSLERPIERELVEEAEVEYAYRLGELQVSADLAGAILKARRLLLREPDRSRRVLRLVCANWLAHLDSSGPRPTRPAVRAAFAMLTSTNPIGWSNIGVPLYPVSPLAPAQARSLPPAELARWLVTTTDARFLLIGSSWPADRLRDRAIHRELVVLLAGELYQREHGVLPPSDEALVGTYLKRLPSDGSDEVDDGSAPTIAGSRVPAEPSGS